MYFFTMSAHTQKLAMSGAQTSSATGSRCATRPVIEGRSGGDARAIAKSARTAHSSAIAAKSTVMARANIVSTPIARNAISGRAVERIFSALPDVSS